MSFAFVFCLLLLVSHSMAFSPLCLWLMEVQSHVICGEGVFYYCCMYIITDMHDPNFLCSWEFWLVNSLYFEQNVIKRGLLQTYVILVLLVFVIKTSHNCERSLSHGLNDSEKTLKWPLKCPLWVQQCYRTALLNQRSTLLKTELTVVSLYCLLLILFFNWHCIWQAWRPSLVRCSSQWRSLPMWWSSPSSVWVSSPS